MPTTKSPGSNRENENKKMGTSNAPGNENRTKENTKGHSKQQQHGQNQKSHNK